MPRYVETSRGELNVEHIMMMRVVPDPTGEGWELLADTPNGDKFRIETNRGVFAEREMAQAALDLFIDAGAHAEAISGNRIDMAAICEKAVARVERIVYDHPRGRPVEVPGESTPIVERVARICHEANRAYCQTIGDFSQRPWAEADEWQRKSAIEGVVAQVESGFMLTAEGPAQRLDGKQDPGRLEMGEGKRTRRRRSIRTSSRTKPCRTTRRGRMSCSSP